YQETNCNYPSGQEVKRNDASVSSSLGRSPLGREDCSRGTPLSSALVFPLLCVNARVTKRCIVKQDGEGRDGDSGITWNS
ncbi:hypothetical protein Hamer_G017264, partial [Homarus americanus]